MSLASREENEDIGSLVMHFLANACAEQGRKVSLDSHGLKTLCGIQRRELSAALERNRWIRTKAVKDPGSTSDEIPGQKVRTGGPGPAESIQSPYELILIHLPVEFGLKNLLEKHLHVSP